ncbi:MAG: hypothetical protein CME43_15835 [Haliea sp.]|nr:hypothetical protein [Haliea sp.]
MWHMLQRKAGLFVVLLVLVTFTGQLVSAASSPCIMLNTGSVPESAHFAMGMNHAGHMAASGVVADEPACCDALLCSLLHCLSSGAALLAAPLATRLAFSSVLNAGDSLSSVVAEGSSLFRPPIFR